MCHQEIWTGELVLQDKNRLFHHTHYSHVVPYSPDGIVDTGNIRSGPLVLRAACTSEHHALVSGFCTQTHIITLTPCGPQIVTKSQY